MQEGRVPLPRKVTLSWVGFTSEGIPAIYDSTGLASILDRYRRPGNQARWVPILDSKSLKKEGRTERHWPVGVSATHLSCVILKVSQLAKAPGSKLNLIRNRAVTKSHGSHDP